MCFRTLMFSYFFSCFTILAHLFLLWADNARSKVAKGDEATVRRRIFVANLNRLMEARGFTVRETAQKAGIDDFKRFCRWASTGITRATRKHDADLEKLRILFGLSGLKQFWPEPDGQASSTKTDRVTSLADRILAAGKFEREYDIAYKLIVVLKSQKKQDADEFSEAIENLFFQAIEGKLSDDNGETADEIGESPEDILEPKTPERIISFLRINYPDAVEAAVKKTGSEHSVLTKFRNEIQKRGSAKGFLKEAIRWALQHVEGGAE